MDEHFDGGWDAHQSELELDQHLQYEQSHEEQHQQYEQQHGGEQHYPHEPQQPEASGSHSPQTPCSEAIPGKPQTTKRARAAGEARRKVDPRFICPVENCGATFTRCASSCSRQEGPRG